MRLRTKLKLNTVSGNINMDLEIGKGKKVSYLIIHLIKYFLSPNDIAEIKKELKNH